MKMKVFEAIPKKWGNSLGITIPKNVIENEGISQNKKINVIVFTSRMEKLRKAFGTLKLKKRTQKVMDEIDEGYD